MSSYVIKKESQQPRLVDFRALTHQHKALLLSRCGFPYRDDTKDGRTCLEMDTFSDVSATGYEPQADHLGRSYHSLKTDCQSTIGTPLSKIVSLARSGNTACLKQYLGDLYSSYHSTHRVHSCRVLSHNQFYAKLQQQLMRYGERIDILQLCFGQRM